jgi:hypothetical protein
MALNVYPTFIYDLATFIKKYLQNKRIKSFLFKANRQWLRAQEFQSSVGFFSFLNIILSFRN